MSSYFSLDRDTGLLRIIKPMDRDLPEGFPVWSMFVFAKDSFSDEIALEGFVEVKIELEDINDNAPFLDMPSVLFVNRMNKQPGTVCELFAEDFDTTENGPPYTFSLDKNAVKDLKNMFAVKKGEVGDKYYLETKKVFEKDEQKTYQIPIRIEDNKGLAATSILNLSINPSLFS